MNHLSLFNGIGGFMLAAELVGWQNIAYVEKEQWLNYLTAKHFPNAIGHRFIEEFDTRPYTGAIDIISGGDPCQPHSYAGLGKGTDDDRYLWPQIFRCIREIHPAWIINENVPGTVSNGVLDIKINDLESEGYACQAYNIPAEAVGALHERKRIWLVGHNPNYRIKGRKPEKHDKEKIKKIISKRDKIQYIGEPVNLWSSDPDCYEKRREYEYPSTIPGKKESVQRFFGFGTHPHGNIPTNVIKSAIIGMLNGLPEGLDYNNRPKRCIALGNAIVWQVAYEMFECIDKIDSQ